MIFLLLKFAIKDFIEDREFRNLSPVTIQGYQIDLRNFERYITEKLNKSNVEEITKNDIKSYFVYCRNERGNNAVTVNHKLINIRAFFNYLVEEGILEKSPVEIEKLKTDVRIETFTDEHIRQMLRYYRRLKYRDKSFYAYRDYTIIVTLLGTGIRRGELCNIRWKDIDLTNDKLIVFGKARRQRTIPLTKKLKNELTEYQVFYKKHFGGITDDDYVFVNTLKRQMSENAVQQIFKRLNKIMNFKDVRLSAHTFRHTFAKYWILNGGDITVLQKILGHKTIEMTNRYLNLFGSAIVEQNDKFNPLNNIDI